VGKGFSPLVGSPIRMYMLVGGGGRGVPCPWAWLILM